MKVIVAGYIDFENASGCPDNVGRPHIEGAKKKAALLSWTECHLTPGRVYVMKSGHPLRRSLPTLLAIGIEIWVATLHPSPESRARM